MDIYRIALVWLEEGRNFALGTVVHAQGSTPQKAGSKAILDDQGNQEGTLGGGLVEAQGLERMKQAISDKTAKLYEVRLDEAYSRSAGPICGGVMRLFANPQGRANAEVYRSAVEAVEKRERGLLVTSLSGDAGLAGLARWVELENGSPADPSLRGEDIERCLREETPLVSETEGGGEVFIEPILPRPRLLIVGAGHVGQAVARQGVDLGFEVTVYDDRPELCGPENFPEEVHAMHGDLREMVSAFPKDADTYIVLVSKGHKPDAEALEGCIHSSPAYLGMIGSERKIRFLRKHFIADGLATADEFDRVVAPIGYDVGAVTVPEIAVSIGAQLVAARRNPAAVSEIAPKSLVK